MRRVTIFLIILIASLAALTTLTAIGYAIFTSAQNPYNWMSQMFGGTSGMGGMMGQTNPSSTNPLISYFGALFAVFIGVTVVGIIGVSYYLLYPQIRMGAAPSNVQIASQPQVPNGNGSSPYESVSKTLTIDERKIIDVLNAHQGKYLQKYIRNETGLSRLQTHRIIARLSDRGILSLEKTGNTNQVYLADWLRQQSDAK
jgi:hypothetical protein